MKSLKGFLVEKVPCGEAQPEILFDVACLLLDVSKNPAYVRPGIPVGKVHPDPALAGLDRICLYGWLVQENRYAGLTAM